jgi:HlyD family secretion protein
MDIVPHEDRLVVEAQVRPQDVDKFFRGTHAIVRFSAFDRNSTPELFGDVTTVSGDRLTDPTTLETYYAVRVTIPAAEIARLENLRLRAGMPAEVFIQTFERTALSYFMKPLLDALMRSFLED